MSQSSRWRANRLMNGFLAFWLHVWVIGCSTTGSQSVGPDGPVLTAAPQDLKDLETRARKQDESLHACKASCGPLLYTRGLLALFESREKAKRLFKEVVDIAPLSPQATSSRHWLVLLEEGHAADPRHDLLSRYVQRELLERDGAAQQARIKALQRQNEQLATQLEMLKQIDHAPKGSAGLP